MKFNEILKHYKESIYKWKYNNYNYYKWRVYMKYVPKISIPEWLKCLLRQQISLNDLISLESWFLQACKWKKENRDNIATISNKYFAYNREYHAMILSILSKEEKIKYLENNVIVE